MPKSPPSQDAALDALLGAAWTFVCAQRVSAFVDPARLVPAVADAATPARLERVLARFAEPARERLFARHRASKTPLSAWVPESVRTELRRWLGAPAPIPKALVDELVRSQNVREGVRTMLYETLTGFLQRAFEGIEGSGVAGGRGSRLRGALSLGARVAGGVASGVLQGIGSEVQRQLEDKVREFVDASVGAVLDKIAAGLSSAETARLLGSRRRALLDAILAGTEADAVRFGEQTPWSKIDPMRAPMIAHNAARAEVRAAIVDELRAAVDELSKTTLGELLAELGLTDAARDAFFAHGRPLVREFFATDAFTTWWNAHTGDGSGPGPAPQSPAPSELP